MKKNKVQATTVSVDVVVRDYINKQAEDLGISQREMVARIVDSFKISAASVRDGTESDEILEVIKSSIDKVLKRDDRVIAFIKEQERIFLTPILQGVQSTSAEFNQLIQVLSNLE